MYNFRNLGTFEKNNKDKITVAGCELFSCYLGIPKTSEIGLGSFLIKKMGKNIRNSKINYIFAKYFNLKYKNYEEVFLHIIFYGGK